ncbi:MAG: DUF763 domain-containing protein, partial [Saprospiraceae bacterium]|nr:DUF763 domain-containing protein [Saprospiraceae bacterium]
MKRSGHADLPLHGGRVPPWLAERMTMLGTAIIESILTEYGRDEVLRRLSDPLWFQSLGCVMGMDWHSSGITTSVMGALKRGINARSQAYGLYVCGGRGKHSRKTPDELLGIASHTGLDGTALVRSSKLTAKIDNTAVQDGFQLYLHSFVLSSEGNWTVVQQGMNPAAGKARRYHWHSPSISSFVNSPHTAVCGESQGKILNLVHHDATPTRDGILGISHLHPDRFAREVRKIVMPVHHDVRAKDINLKRLASIIALAHESRPDDFTSLLLLRGLGPRTLQSLTLVSEIIHGTPSRFDDPARFSLAHGGKDGHPFPVPLAVFDETIAFLNAMLKHSKLGQSDKARAFQQLTKLATRMEHRFTPDAGRFDQWIDRERGWSDQYGGRTVFDDRASKQTSPSGGQ